ncbi:hypothetical protein [Streptomyces bugieae]|uniref:Secreted protein n=1 Tax=Streptomyces bugieae TaxID=3098223 RepID=A0ABU7NMA1_9ACTN|nr:hypothetical protein [Streptomyces sp. DSM 41528]
MDEGKAALYAAIIGFAAAVIGTIVGGWVTWRAARHGADVAVQAAIEQVTGQAASEHTHWVRQERRTICGNILRHYCAVVDALSRLNTAARAGQPAEALIEEVMAAGRKLHHTCYETRLFGPDELHHAAARLAHATEDDIDAHKEYVRHLQSDDSTHTGLAEWHLREAALRVGEQATAFTRVCQQILLHGEKRPEE